MAEVTERIKVSAAAETSGGTSWRDDMQAYEHARRHEIAPGFVAGAPMRLNERQVKLQERAFDPLLGKLRDDGAEAQQCAFEQRERLRHLNRAKDVQILREHPHDIINHRSRLADAIGGEAKIELTFADPNTTAHPVTCADYNIISNLPLDLHHWGHPEDRPRCHEKLPRVRRVPASNLKDFNVISNRYLKDHDAKFERDRTLDALEATAKFRMRSRFDPVKQKFTCPREEERQRAADDARETEIVVRGQFSEPPSSTGRVTSFYDAITHQTRDEGMLRVRDAEEQARKSRYRTRYDVENDLRHKDIQFEDMAVVQKSEMIAHERFEETARRGYDIVTNKTYGERPHETRLQQPYTMPRLTAWEKVLDQRLEPPPAATVGGAAPASARGSAIGSARGSARSVVSARPMLGAGALSDAGAKMATPRLQAAVPPAPAVPGSPVGSVYSRPKAT